MNRSVVGLLAALLGVPAALVAQTPPPPPADTGNVILLDVTVHPGEFDPHTVFLQKGIVYRASFSGPGVAMRMRSYKGKQLPYVVSLTSVVEASGSSEYEIYPQSDGDIEFQELFNEGQVPVTFRLWRDARATEHGRRSAEEGFWELGVDLLVGGRGSIHDNVGLPTGSGMTIGGCLGVRNGPGPLGFLNGCIFGLERLSSSTTPGFYLFTEPEIRLSNHRRTDSGWKFEWGLLMRYAAFGSDDDGGNLDNGEFGFGGYVARDQRDLNGRGWRITLTGRADAARGGAGGNHRLWAPAFQLGVGRYH